MTVAYELFSRVSLAEDLPEYGLHKSDLATIVERHEGGPGRETGYSLEVFNAVGETIAVLVVIRPIILLSASAGMRSTNSSFPKIRSSQNILSPSPFLTGLTGLTVPKSSLNHEVFLHF
jgi:hypothetical protein